MGFKLSFFLFFFFLISSDSLLSSSCVLTVAAACRPSKLVHKAAATGLNAPAATVAAAAHESDMKRKRAEMEEILHERILRANTKDYGRYDPSPTFVKPPFKLIPN